MAEPPPFVVKVENNRPSVVRATAPLPGAFSWVPEVVNVPDGDRVVQQIIGYYGGQGTAPTAFIGYYLGEEGLVADIEDASDIRGPTGAGSGDVTTSGAVTSGGLAVFADTSGDLLRAAASGDAGAIRTLLSVYSQAQVTSLLSGYASLVALNDLSDDLDAEIITRGDADTALDGRLDTAEAKLTHITVTQAVDLDAIETRVNALDAAVVLKGTWAANAGTFPGSGTAQAGDSWIVSVAGTVNSVAFAVGDRIIAILDNASTSTFASNWFKADYTDQVLSVNGETGAVTLTTDDISDTGQTNKWSTAAEKAKLTNISVSQAVNLDTMETDLAAAMDDIDDLEAVQGTIVTDLDAAEADIAALEAADTALDGRIDTLEALKALFDAAASTGTVWKRTGTGAGQYGWGADSTGGGGGGGGDMFASMYDPNTVESDAFDMDNMVEGATNLILTGAERTKLGHVTVTQAVDLDAIETRVNALDAAVVLKGVWDASAGTFPGSGTAQAGDSWIVSVAGTVNSIAFAVGDRIIAILDNASTSTYASNWFKADYTDAVSSVVGLTGAVGQSALRSALALVPGTDVQMQSAQLQAIDDLTWAAGKLMKLTGTAGLSAIDISSNAESILAAADYSAMRTLLSLRPTIDVQTQSAKLQAIADLTWAANKLMRLTGTGALDTIDLSENGASLIAATNYAAMRTLLTLEIMASGDLRAGTSGKVLTADGVHTDNAPVDLGTFGSTITPNLANWFNAYGTLPAGGGTVTLANPSTNGKPGSVYALRLTQGAAASTIAFGTDYHAAGGVSTITLTATPGVKDIIYIKCHSATEYWVSIEKNVRHS